MSSQVDEDVAFGKVSIKDFLEEEREKKPFRKKCLKSFKGIDLYGKQIVLTYKGSETYNTTIGGIFSFFVIIILLYYFLAKLANIINRGDTTFAKKSFFVDLDSDENKVYDLSKAGFDWAFEVSGKLLPSIGFFYANKVTLNFDEKTGKRNSVKVPIKLS